MRKIDIDKDNNEVRLVVDTEFYGYAAVLLSSQAFSKNCWVYLDGDINDKLLVSLKPRSEEIDIKTLGHEFYNYVLGLMQNART